MGLELSTIVAFAVGIILLYVLGLLLVIPIKIIIKLMINGVIGGITLFLVNIVGGIFGLSIGINPVTALIAGFLGFPGVVILLILQLIS